MGYARVTGPDLGVRVRLTTDVRVEAERTDSGRETTQSDNLVVSGDDIPSIVERRSGRRAGSRAVPVGQFGAVFEFIDTDTDAWSQRDVGADESFGECRVGFDGG